jgi:diphosphomevalonate decarboxylase
MGLKLYSAPSNIALIKYMGKTNSKDNLPTNTSLSYTLEHLRTFVTIEKISTTNDSNSNLTDQWQPLSQSEFNALDNSSVNTNSKKLYPLELSEKGKSKFLNHLNYLKDLAQVKDSFLIKSANNFPSDCGIASSSSSFAALTVAAMSEFQKLSSLELDLSPSYLSSLSRKGSGSSCRSFFSPWCAWQKDRGFAKSFALKDLHHLVLLLDVEKKEVSSSEAHLRVTTSPIFKQRLDVIENRYEHLVQAMEKQDWPLIRSICGVEFEEMHQLFETSVPAFSYRSDNTFKVLKELKSLEATYVKTAPLVTMDAGSNIHLLFRSEDLSLAKQYAELFKQYNSINSWDGSHE